MRRTFCLPLLSRASTAMITRLVKRRTTSQIGARCLISLCVRTVAICKSTYIPLVMVFSHFTRLRRSKSDNIFPVPSTTEASGSSASETGSPVSIDNRLSRFLSNAPPPVSTIPRSTISAESSGGVRSNATRTALMIVEIESAKPHALLHQ